MIDIIVPIYNGFEDLKGCMESIRLHTNLKENRLILINDNSTDKRVGELLRELQGQNIVVMENKENKGFSSNVNKGMAFSDNDVILLNSDTCVTEGWVEKLKECAYSKENIATVTPISNNATLTSFPDISKENELPPNVTVDELSKVIEQCSVKRYPEIPVGVGFCMYIRRDAIRRTGAFDEAAFERGYGEENDFCYRAAQLGFIHVMCDDTFIYHKGTASFPSEEKQRLIKEHERILEERYGEQIKEGGSYSIIDPNKDLRDNIKLWLALDNDRRNILFLSHLDFCKEAKENVGGTQYHIKDLVDGLKHDNNVITAARDRDYLRITVYVDEGIYKLKYFIGNAPLYPVLYNSDIKELLELAVNSFNIDLIHVHHTQDIGLDIYDIAKVKNIPVIFTAHDYYYICPDFKLTTIEESFCAGLGQEADCKSCLNGKKNISTNIEFIKNWRKEHKKALEICDKLVFPSNAAKEIFARYYPDILSKAVTIYHGYELISSEYKESDKICEAYEIPNVHVSIDSAYDDDKNQNAIKGWAVLEGVDNNKTSIYIEVLKENKFYMLEADKYMRRDVLEYYDYIGDSSYENSGFVINVYEEFLREEFNYRVIIEYEGIYYTDSVIRTAVPNTADNNECLNIAFIGGMMPEKGSRIAGEIIKKSPKEVKFYIFGTIYDQELNNLEADNLIKAGRYTKKDIEKLLKGYHIDLVCILPIWAETFCYTLSEALLCKIPVIATDIGAVGERMKGTNNGWLLSVNKAADEAVGIINNILSDKSVLTQKKQAVDCYSEKSVKAMLSDYTELYSGFGYGRERRRDIIDYPKILSGIIVKDSVPFTDNVKYKTHMKINEITALQNRTNQTLIETRQELDSVYNSTTYKLAKKLTQLNIPFKKQIKDILKK